MARSSIDTKHKELYRKIHYNILLEDRISLKPQNWLFYYRQIAAILVPILVLAGLLYFILELNPTESQSWVEINAPIGAKTEFLLPDSTTGWLNNGAKLRYPLIYGKHREVKLLGEAFFHVKHIAKSDFTVKVADMDIKVLGTKFNVSAYDDEEQTKVVLEEGKVQVNGTQCNFDQTLRPGEILVFNHRTTKLYKDEVDTDVYTAWTSGYLVIDNEPVGEAVRKIGRWFNVDVDIKADSVRKLRLKATFKEESLEEVLRFIAMTTPIDYQIVSGKYDAAGLRTRTKIIINQR